MKKYILIIVTFLFFISCRDKEPSKQIIIFDSTHNSSILTDTGTRVQIIHPNDIRINPPIRRTVHHRTTVYRNTPNQSVYQQPVQRRRGWSHAAKDAVIGGAGGAVAGAIIGKGKGAIIGGVVGAGGGYILGRSRDKKEGRIK